MKHGHKIKNSISFLLKPLTSADIFLLVLFIILAVSSMFFVSLLQKQGEIVQIFQNNEMKYQISLNKNKRILLKDPQGFVQIYLKDKKVWVHESSCPTKICKKMGKISKTGQTIICVPNKVFIRIVGKSKKKYIDVITQ